MSFAGKKILVTGGAGFVGSNVVKALVKADAAVTVLDDLFTGRKENLPRSRSGRFIKGTVCDFKVVRRLVRNADLVLHAAARNIICSTKNPREDFETNIGGTLNVLLAARESNIERLVYTSSASVYGNPKYLPINEDEPPRTLSPYSVSKLAGENYGLAFYDSYGIPVSILRYSNVYGPNQHPSNPYCGVVGKFIHDALQGLPLHIHGDGNNTRDYTYVDDAVDVTLAALGNPRSEGQIFNVGSGTETSVIHLCEVILAATKSTSSIEHIQRRDIDNIRRRVLNIEQARRILHWQPQVSLHEGIRKTVEWVMTQP